MRIARLAADHDRARLESDPQVLQQHAQVARGPGRPVGTAVEHRAPRKASAQPLRPHEQRGPSICSTVWPISPAMPAAPVNRRSLSTTPAPTPTSQLTKISGSSPSPSENSNSPSTAASASFCSCTAMPASPSRAKASPSSGQEVEVAPAEVGREAHHAGGVVERPGHADADARQPQAGGDQVGMRRRRHPRHLRAGHPRRAFGQRLRIGIQHLAPERDADHAHRLDRDLDPQQRAHADVDRQRRRRPPQSVGDRRAGLVEPAVVEQLAHQQAHGRLGEAALGGQPRARQAGPRAQQPQQHAAVDPLDELLVARGLHPACSACGFPSGRLPAMIIRAPRPR